MKKTLIVATSRLIKLLANITKVLSYPFHWVMPNKRFTLPAQSSPLLKGGKPGPIPRIIWQTNFTDRVTLPVYLNALTGEGVHMVTVNDYLARRDSEDMGRLYRYLGLTVGLVVHDMDFPERKFAYSRDVTFGTNNEFGFDYLRDNMVIYPEQMVQRKLHYAIVDEVDSILIDEARTPLIISGPGAKSTDMYAVMAKAVAGLKEGIDYTVDEKQKTVAPADNTIPKVERILGINNLYAPENIELSHCFTAALRAKALMKRDRDYVVRNGEIIIVDEFTGRLMEGRRYSDGLHQAIEAKEGVKTDWKSSVCSVLPSSC